MDKRVLFIDLEDGHIFLDSTPSYEYWPRREFRKDPNRIINPAGIYASNDRMKALQLTELISPSLPWKNHPLNFEINADKNDTNPTMHCYYWTYDHFYYKEATPGCNFKDGSFTLYFKRSDPEIVNTYDGPKRVDRVINKSLTFLENEQSAGLRILRTTTLECIKDDLRKMGVKLHCDPVKPKIDYTRARPITAAYEDLVMPVTIKEELKKSLINSYYGMGGFTTTHPDTDRVLAMAEAFKMWKNKNKETETMEKKKMTQTDSFLKDLNDITITSTYSKLEHCYGKPYYIYYPEIEEITEDIVDTLLTVLLMAKRDYVHKVVFNPEKGTTTMFRRWDSESVTVRCRDGEFDYILGYEMARTKMYLGSDNYNWFNKIKNHRKTHIEYTEKSTEPKAKRTSKKGGKK